MGKNKLEELADIEGYDSITEMISEATFDGISPGICTNEGCSYTTQVEPDQSAGYCEDCDTNTVKSCLILAGVI